MTTVICHGEIRSKPEAVRGSSPFQPQYWLSRNQWWTSTCLFPVGGRWEWVEHVGNGGREEGGLGTTIEFGSSDVRWILPSWPSGDSSWVAKTMHRFDSDLSMKLNSHKSGCLLAFFFYRVMGAVQKLAISIRWWGRINVLHQAAGRNRLSFPDSNRSINLSL